MDIDIALLRTITDKLLVRMLDMGITKVELTADYYWDIPPEALYDNYDEPQAFEMGQLSEDLTFVQEVADGTRPPVSYALVWVASLLKFVGEKVVE